MGKAPRPDSLAIPGNFHPLVPLRMKYMYFIHIYGTRFSGISAIEMIS